MSGDRCHACSNSGVIALQTSSMKSEPLPIDNDLNVIPGDYSTFPCPVCQPVFYLYDLEQVQSLDIIENRKLESPGFRQYLREKQTSSLGRQLSVRCVETVERTKSGFLQEPETAIGRRVFAIKRDAKGWQNYKGGK